MGYSADEANLLANQLGLIPGQVASSYTGYGFGTGKSEAQTLKDLLTQIDGKNTSSRHTHELVYSIGGSRVTYAEYKAAQAEAGGRMLLPTAEQLLPTQLPAQPAVQNINPTVYPVVRVSIAGKEVASQVSSVANAQRRQQELRSLAARVG
jgi:hypothetical protein